jgi:DNA primase
MRPAPGNWARFNADKYEQYPASRERKFFNTAAPVVPYQLPDLLKAVAAAQTICIAEGEKKVDLIRSFGFPATCCAGGANKWRPEHSASLQGADVVLLPDNDPVGRTHNGNRRKSGSNRQANTHP